MELNRINEILSNTANLTSSKHLVFIEKVEVAAIKEHYGEPEQGGSAEYYKVFKVVNEDSLYLKVSYGTYSYGENDYISSIQFCKPAQKQITSYEPV